MKENHRRDSLELVIRNIPSVGFFASMFLLEELGTFGSFTDCYTGFPR